MTFDFTLRFIIGTYHEVSVKHPDANLDELEWLFKNREIPFWFRDTLIKLLKAESLPYQGLTA